MTYLVSDLCGNYEKFKDLLSAISFSDADSLYLLGDLVDYGDASIELVEDLSLRLNVYPMAGEHDYKAARMLSGFDKMLSSGENPDVTFIREMQEWVSDGGQTTLDAYRTLDKDRREGVLEYLFDLPLFEEVSVGDKDYLLLHMGLAKERAGEDLYDLAPEDFFSTPLTKAGLPQGGITVAVGHKPTESGKIEYGKNCIFLDCGVKDGGKLGCLCLETMDETYV